MSLDPPDRDLSLLGLAEEVQSFTGHVHDIPRERLIFMLGLFEGATSRLYKRIVEIWQEEDGRSCMEALPALHQVMLALGADEDWHE